ncbi:MAG: hypothetical protein KDA57_18505 [Planctomycetales bacterium]|nr:hypothetical protein [Planctomycetales bacterium]
MRILSSSLIACSALLVGCSSAPYRGLPEPIALPESAEPAYDRANYQALPPGTAVVVRFSTEELKTKLMRQFPALASDRASLVLVEEDLVTAGQAFYRRIWFSYGDEATLTIHGTCGQNIMLWFTVTGELYGTFVDEMFCPI